MKKSELRKIIREELLNEAKLTVGGIKFITSISLNNNLEINFIPSKMVEDKSKVWDMLEKHLKKKLKFKVSSLPNSPSAGFTFAINKYDIQDWFMKFIK